MPRGYTRVGDTMPRKEGPRSPFLLKSRLVVDLFETRSQLVVDLFTNTLFCLEKVAL
jgi:hypothetical protein